MLGEERNTFGEEIPRFRQNVRPGLGWLWRVAWAEVDLTAGGNVALDGDGGVRSPKRVRSVRPT